MNMPKVILKKIMVVSDNCGRQNKNINVLINYLVELHSGRLQHIDHYFFISFLAIVS